MAALRYIWSLKWSLAGFAAALLLAGAGVAAVIIYGLGQNTMYFRSPSDVAAKMVGEGIAFRLGGLVEQGSVKHGAGAEVHFRVTDGKSSVPADFNGVLPALFREGQGVVATGAMNASGTLDRYVPFDVSESALVGAAAMMDERYPDVTVHGVRAEFLGLARALPELEARDAALAANRDGRYVLWFEADLYDQRIIDFFQQYLK